MDIDKFLNPKFEFSGLNVDYLREHDIATDEIVEVIRNVRTEAINSPLATPKDYRWICTGFSKRSRAFVIFLKFQYNRYFLQDIKLADEDDIEIYWCRKRRRPRI